MKYLEIDGTQKDHFSVGLDKKKIEFRTFNGIAYFRNYNSPWYRLEGKEDLAGFPDELRFDFSTSGAESRFQIPIAGIYKFFEYKSSDYIGEVAYREQSPSRITLTTQDPRITNKVNNIGTLNIYQSAGLLTFENRTGANLSLTIIRLNKRLDL